MCFNVIKNKVTKNPPPQNNVEINKKKAKK